MATEADVAAQNVYRAIMEEVKLRAYSINAIKKSPRIIHDQLVGEYCFLQLRMLCELIALGCLVAHGDIKEIQTKEFQKAWKAADIIQKLERLHPNFYPVPRKIEFPKPGHVHLADYDQPYLTKEELVSLYGKCGDIVHKGSIKRFLNPQPLADFADIDIWGQKILNLLSQHLISRVGGNFHILTALSAAQLNGNVLVVIAESPKVPAETSDAAIST